MQLIAVQLVVAGGCCPSLNAGPPPSAILFYRPYIFGYTTKVISIGISNQV